MEFVLAFAVGLIFGGILVFLLKHREIKQLESSVQEKDGQISQLQAECTKLTVEAARLSEQQKNAEEKIALWNEAKEKLVGEFKALSADALKSNSTQFLELAKTNLEKFPTLIQEMIRFKRTFKTIRSSDYFLSLMPRYYKHEQIEGCPAGLRWIQITPEGWYKPCSELPPVVFWNVYDHKKSFEPQECTLCWYGCRGEAQTPIGLSRIREFI